MAWACLFRSKDSLCRRYQSMASPRMAFALAEDPNRRAASPEGVDGIRKIDSTSLAGGRVQRNDVPWLMQHPELNVSGMSM